MALGCHQGYSFRRDDLAAHDGCLGIKDRANVLGTVHHWAISWWKHSSFPFHIVVYAHTNQTESRVLFLHLPKIDWCGLLLPLVACGLIQIEVIPEIERIVRSEVWTVVNVVWPRAWRDSAFRETTRWLEDGCGRVVSLFALVFACHFFGMGMVRAMFKSAETVCALSMIYWSLLFLFIPLKDCM